MLYILSLLFLSTVTSYMKTVRCVHYSAESTRFYFHRQKIFAFQTCITIFSKSTYVRVVKEHTELAYSSACINFNFRWSADLDRKSHVDHSDRWRIELDSRDTGSNVVVVTCRMPASAFFVVEQDISAAEANRRNACRSTSGCFYTAARSAYDASDSASVTRESRNDDEPRDHDLLRGRPNTR